MIDLRDCPFCGGHAGFVQTTYGTDSQSACLRFEIRCKDCGAKAPESHGKLLIKLQTDGSIVAWRDDREDAIRTWNRRADDESKV